MSGSPPQFPILCPAKHRIHVFQRSEEAGESAFQMTRTRARGMKVAVAELVRDRNHSSAHRPVFMGTLRPRKVCICIDPYGKSHCNQYITRGSI
jgi:hypothetical protein